MRRSGCTVLAVVAVGLSSCGSTSLTGDLAAAGSTKPGQSSSARLYRVPSGSMEPTLLAGEMAIVSAGAPRIGEIVVYHDPEGAEREECGPSPHTIEPGGAACAEPVPKASTFDFVKRIVAAPGDEIYISDGHVYRRARGANSFVREPDPYIRPCGSGHDAGCNFPTPIEIPAGHWYLLGDNRGESDDSRFWGAVPTSWIVGVVKACDIGSVRRGTLRESACARSRVAKRTLH